jgi:hypothetical protein
MCAFNSINNNLFSWHRDIGHISLYDNKRHILSLNEELGKCKFDIHSIKEVYHIGLTSYSDKVVSLIRKINRKQSYYLLNTLSWYLQLYIDDDGYEDFIGDVIHLYLIKTTPKKDYLVVIRTHYSDAQKPGEELIMLETTEHFNLCVIEYAKKVCDKLPPASVFD